MVEVFAYQETLLIMAVFGIVVLAMVWVGFGRWLQHKDRMGRLLAEQTAERAAQYGAHIERVEARLNAVEQSATDGGATAEQIDAPRTAQLPDPTS
jgi:hypothetical protein